MTTDLRPPAPQQWDLFFDRFLRVFGGPGDAPEERALWQRLSETERSLAAWDGDEIVGTSGAFSFRMTVPGGAAAAVAGVTLVSVQPTHRRRGVLTSMMRRLLDDFHARGESAAILTASEAAIYGRFGYGIATTQMYGSIDTTRVAFAAPAEAGVRFRLAPAAEVSEQCEAVYTRLVAERPGMLARQPGWQDLPVLDPPRDRGDAGELLCVLAESDGEVRGYARYAVAAGWTHAGPDNTVKLRDVEALDPATYAALWRFLGSIDLSSRIVFRNRPADDPLLHLASDIRRCGIGHRDGMHLRLVDVAAALSARTYSTPVDVVLDVEDTFCPWNSGRWRLTGDTKGANCERTTDPAELALAVRELGAAYLGGPSLRALAAAGSVRELRPGALAEASRAFHGDIAPWLPHGF